MKVKGFMAVKIESGGDAFMQNFSNHSTRLHVITTQKTIDIGHDCFHRNPFQFIIHTNHPIIRRQITWAVESVVK